MQAVQEVKQVEQELAVSPQGLRFAVLLETGRITAFIGMLVVFIGVCGLLLYLFLRANPGETAEIVSVLGNVILLTVPFASATSLGHTYLNHRAQQQATTPALPTSEIVHTQGAAA